MNKLAQHGSTSARKKSRGLGRGARKPRDTPQAWLRRLICPFDFGLKVTKTDPETGRASSHPIHYNRNRNILAAFRDKRRWRHVDRLTNGMLDAHWRGEESFYFTGAGSSRCRRMLVNLDIDCHAAGSPEGAVEAAEYLKANFFPDLYHEPSTNGRGRHGYFVLEKCGLTAEGVKRLLKPLERRLDEHLRSKGFDIELFEIKGLPPVLTWGDDGEVTNYTAGILAKIPREVHRFEEWKMTTVLTDWEVGRLVTRLRPTTPAELSITPTPTPSKGSNAEVRAPGSMSGKVITEGELAQLAEGGRYRELASTLLGTHTIKTSGRTVVTPEDVAVFLLCVRFFTNRMNADGTLPVKRFEGLWSALYEAGDVGRAFDCHRFKAVRDYLSGLNLLDWEDNTFVAPMKDRDGTRRNGRACKWKAGEKLMGMLDWEESGDGAGAVGVEDAQGEKEGEGGASLVGTESSPAPSLTSDTLIETIRSLSRVPDGEEIRPTEAPINGLRRPRLFTPEDITMLVVSFEDSMERLAA